MDFNSKADLEFVSNPDLRKSGTHLLKEMFVLPFSNKAIQDISQTDQGTFLQN